jgi:predicted Rossmann-fold nucleotide-binding protein
MPPSSAVTPKLVYRDLPCCDTGGFGTFEELLEVVTWQQLGFHSKPIGLLNIEGYYDQLLAFFENAITEVGACSWRGSWEARQRCVVGPAVPTAMG